MRIHTIFECLQQRTSLVKLRCRKRRNKDNGALAPLTNHRGGYKKKRPDQFHDPASFELVNNVLFFHKLFGLKSVFGLDLYDVQP